MIARGATEHPGRARPSLRHWHSDAPARILRVPGRARIPSEERLRGLGLRFNMPPTTRRRVWHQRR